MSLQLLTKAQLARHIRSHVAVQLYDESGSSPRGIAIYALSDPRAFRDVRYVGQTSAPKRRFLQHLNTARLWSPDETPWWVKSPKLRPLFEWIRGLYRDEFRLPTVIISGWAETVANTRLAERANLRVPRETTAAAERGIADNRPATAAGLANVDATHARLGIELITSTRHADAIDNYGRCVVPLAAGPAESGTGAIA